jgi:hypothetical protein
VLTEFIWPRIGTTSGFLWTRYWIPRSIKCGGFPDLLMRESSVRDSCMAWLVLDRYEFRNWISEILFENSWVISDAKHADWHTAADALSFVPLIRHTVEWLASCFGRFIAGSISLYYWIRCYLPSCETVGGWVSQLSYAVGPHHLITLDNKFQKFFVSVMNMLLIYLFASMKLEKGHKKFTWL